MEKEGRIGWERGGGVDVGKGGVTSGRDVQTTVDEFKRRFSVLAKHVKDNEPLTLSCASPSTRVRRFPVFPGSTRTALLFPLTSRHARFLRPLS